jgi:hypothetical protein
MQVAQKKEIITRILVLAMICLGAFSGCCSGGIDIKVKKSLSTSLDKYHMAEINVQDKDYKTYIEKTSDSSSENTRFYIDLMLSSLLRERGISRACGDKDAVDLRVKCLFGRRFGCPSVGRHLIIEFKHTSFINLKLIDAKTDEIIGEVESKKPFCKRFPGEFIELIFAELMKGQGEKDEKDKP